MVNRIVELTLATLVTVFMIYLLKWIFVKNIQVPVLTPVLQEV